MLLHLNRKYFIVLLLMLGFILPASALARELPDRSQWQFELKPLYIWFVNFDGTSSLPSSDGDGSGSSRPGINYDEVKITGAFSFHFEVEKNNITVFTDYLYSEWTSNNVTLGPFAGSGKNKLSEHLAELGFAYRIFEHEYFEAEVLAGVRYLYAGNKFEYNAANIDLSINRSAHANIWDGFAGVRLTGYILDSLSATVRADIGGGASDLVWNIDALVDWRYIDWGSVYAGYRVLDYKVSNKDIDLNLQGTGPVIGLAFYW